MKKCIFRSDKDEEKIHNKKQSRSAHFRFPGPFDAVADLLFFFFNLLRFPDGGDPETTYVPIESVLNEVIFTFFLRVDLKEVEFVKIGMGWSGLEKVRMGWDGLA